MNPAIAVEIRAHVQEHVTSKQQEPFPIKSKGAQMEVEWFVHFVS